MSWFRYLLLPVLVCPILLLTGALDRPAVPPAVALVAPPADPAATRLLDQALENLTPARVEWLDATLWQQVVGEDGSYQAEGRYLSGPGNRLRLKLQVHLGRTRGEMQVISDGTTLWNVTQIEGGDREVTRTSLTAILKTLSGPDMAPQASEHFLWQRSFAGLVPLLEGLRCRMQATQQEPLFWNLRQVVRLTLYWSEDAARAIAPRGQPWPAAVPRKCRLYLDATTLWPHRLEWWGLGKAEGKETLIYQLEFRDPVINQPLTSEQCTREFSFDPGPSTVSDLTQEVTEQVEAQAKQRMPGPNAGE